MTTLSNKSRQTIFDANSSLLDIRTAAEEALEVIDSQSSALVRVLALRQEIRPNSRWVARLDAALGGNTEEYDRLAKTEITKLKEELELAWSDEDDPLIIKINDLRAQLAVKTTQYETCFRERGEAEQKLIELQSVDLKGMLGSRISDLERKLQEKRLQAAECKLHAAEYVALEDSFSGARQLLKDAASLCSIDELVNQPAFEELVEEINGFLVKHPRVPMVLSVEEQNFEKLECAEAVCAEIRARGVEIGALLFLDACRAADDKLVAKYEK